jgi:hypothetical protein
MLLLVESVLRCLVLVHPVVRSICALTKQFVLGSMQRSGRPLLRRQHDAWVINRWTCCC